MALEAAMWRGVEPAVGGEAGGDGLTVPGVERAQAEREEALNREPVGGGGSHAETPFPPALQRGHPSPSPSPARGEGTDCLSPSHRG